MAEDASGSEPDEGNDDSAFDWGVVEPEDSEQSRHTLEAPEDDDTGETSDRIPMNLGGWKEETAIADEPDANEDGDVEDESEEFVGPEPGSTPIEPESPSLENAVFVVIGAIAMVLVLARLVSLGFG